MHSSYVLLDFIPIWMCELTFMFSYTRLLLSRVYLFYDIEQLTGRVHDLSKLISSDDADKHHSSLNSNFGLPPHITNCPLDFLRHKSVRARVPYTCIVTSVYITFHLPCIYTRWAAYSIVTLFIVLIGSWKTSNVLWEYFIYALVVCGDCLYIYISHFESLACLKWRVLFLPSSSQSLGSMWSFKFS